MYLDKVVVAHNLLQAIARVNRVAGESKDKGFVVDYVGIGHHIRQAIDAYDEREQKKHRRYAQLPGRRIARARSELRRNHGSLEEAPPRRFERSRCVLRRLSTTKTCASSFMSAFRKLTRCLNLVFSGEAGARLCAGTTRALAEINVLAGKHFRDGRLSMKGIPPKLRAITDEHLESRGIDARVPPISILDENFVKGRGPGAIARRRGRRRSSTRSATISTSSSTTIRISRRRSRRPSPTYSNSFRDNWRKILRGAGEAAHGPDRQRPQGADLRAAPQEADALLPHVSAGAVRYGRARRRRGESGGGGAGPVLRHERGRPHRPARGT